LSVASHPHRRNQHRGDPSKALEYTHHAGSVGPGESTSTEPTGNLREPQKSPPQSRVRECRLQRARWLEDGGGRGPPPSEVT
jgi:hypothetical protein